MGLFMGAVMKELKGKADGTEVKNVIVWDKKVHGLGSDYKLTETRKGNHLKHRITIIVPGFKFPVDTIRFSFDFSHEFVVTPNVRAAGSPQKRVDKLALIIRVLFQKAFDSSKALQNPFGVVHSFHPHREVFSLCS